VAARQGWGPKGEFVRRGTNGAQRIRTGGAFWSEEAEEAFFDHLAASCNVTTSAEAVGFTTPTLYRQRRLRADFAARWQAALAQGYARLEMALVLAANDSLDDVAFDAERPIPKMTVDQAMNVLRAHRHTVAGDGRRGPGNPARRRSLDEVRASIARKVEAIRHDEAEARKAARERKRGPGDKSRDKPRDTPKDKSRDRRRAVSHDAARVDPGGAGAADRESRD